MILHRYITTAEYGRRIFFQRPEGYTPPVYGVISYVYDSYLYVLFDGQDKSQPVHPSVAHWAPEEKQ